MRELYKVFVKANSIILVHIYTYSCRNKILLMHTERMLITRPWLWHWQLLLDIFVIHNKKDGHEEEQDDAQHDELVSGDAARHAGEDSPRSGDVVVGAMQRVARMRDGLPLTVQVLQNADPQLL